jgi:hypothetical protein
MPENPFLKMARCGLRMPFGAHVVLHEPPDPEACKYDAELLGRSRGGCAPVPDAFGVPVNGPDVGETGSAPVPWCVRRGGGCVPFFGGSAVEGCFGSGCGVKAAVSASHYGKSERRAVHRGENRSVAGGYADRPVLTDDETGGRSDFAGGHSGQRRHRGGRSVSVPGGALRGARGSNRAEVRRRGADCGRREGDDRLRTSREHGVSVAQAAAGELGYSGALRAGAEPAIAQPDDAACRRS